MATPHQGASQATAHLAPCWRRTSRSPRMCGASSKPITPALTCTASCKSCCARVRPKFPPGNLDSASRRGARGDYRRGRRARRVPRGRRPDWFRHRRRLRARILLRTVPAHHSWRRGPEPCTRAPLCPGGVGACRQRTDDPHAASGSMIWTTGRPTSGPGGRTLQQVGAGGDPEQDWRDPEPGLDGAGGVRNGAAHERPDGLAESEGHREQ